MLTEENLQEPNSGNGLEKSDTEAKIRFLANIMANKYGEALKIITETPNLKNLLKFKEVMIANDNKNLLIHLASEGGCSNKELLKILSLNDNLINARNMQGMTPLHLAVNALQHDTVLILCELGADLLATNHDKENAFDIIFNKKIKNENTKNLAKKLNQQLNATDIEKKEKGRQEMFRQKENARKAFQKESSEQLIENDIKKPTKENIEKANADNTYQFEQPGSAKPENLNFMDALRKHNVFLAANLLIKNPLLDYSQIDKNNGNLPIHYLVETNHNYLIKILCNYPSTNLINTKNNLGKTPLHIAAQRGNDACVGRLLELEADLSIENQEKHTALHLALIHGHTITAQLLWFAHQKLKQENLIPNNLMHIMVKQLCIKDNFFKEKSIGIISCMKWLAQNQLCSIYETDLNKENYSLLHSIISYADDFNFAEKIIKLLIANFPQLEIFLESRNEIAISNKIYKLPALTPRELAKEVITNSMLNTIKTYLRNTQKKLDDIKTISKTLSSPATAPITKRKFFGSNQETLPPNQIQEKIKNIVGNYDSKKENETLANGLDILKIEKNQIDLFFDGLLKHKISIEASSQTEITFSGHNKKYFNNFFNKMKTTSSNPANKNLKEYNTYKKIIPEFFEEENIKNWLTNNSLPEDYVVREYLKTEEFEKEALKYQNDFANYLLSNNIDLNISKKPAEDYFIQFLKDKIQNNQDEIQLKK